MPKPKRAQGNQHNARHENGIVAPGKRIVKQKSNGHLHGNTENPLQLSLPGGRTTSSAPENVTNGFPTTARPRPLSITSIEQTTTDTTETVNSFQDYDGCPEGLQEQQSPQADVKTTMSPLLPKDSALNLAFTIIRACPLGDTIAILLVLLWLPPTLLTVTNALFAVLTFMPSTAALPTFPPSFNDMFLGSGNTPSLATMFITDVIGLVLWLTMWTPIQALAIELAQAIVATTLGGGNSGKRKGSDGTLFCLSLVTLNHVVRHDWLPQQILGFDWHALVSSLPYVSKPVYPTYIYNDDSPMRSPTGWFRALVALHILIQGVVHIARRWYQKREYTQAAAMHKKTDSEPATPPLARQHNTPQMDNMMQIQNEISSDVTMKPTIPKETRDKMSNSKRRKRQGTMVRSQQPLWAAFAATKLTILREYETTLAMRDVADSKAVDERNLGNAPFGREEGRVWIFDVLPDAFSFETSALPTINVIDASSPTRESVIDEQHQPLYVNINDTDWTSTRISKRLVDDKGQIRWTGKVFGLAPASSYRCTFVQGEGGIVLYSATVTTPPSLPVESGRILLVNAYTEHHTYIITESFIPTIERSHQAYRLSSPTSPTATLVKSINAFEASLNDAQARQKRNKKDLKAVFTNLKRDVDFLKAKVEKLTGEDKTHTNRHMQWHQNTRQAEEAIAAISAEIESLGSLPAEDVKLSKERKLAWDDVKNSQAAIRTSLSHTKEAAQRDRMSAQAEATTIQQKRERLSARSAKLQDQHGKLEIATAHSIDEKQRRDSEEAAKDLEHAQVEQHCSEQMANIYRAYQDSRFSTQRAWQEIQSMEAAFREHQMLLSMPTPEERPLTPEGDLPGTNPHLVNPASRVPMFGSPDAPSAGQRSHSGSLRQPETRPRSTSGLSGNSIYADFEDQDPAPPLPARAVEKIKQRGQRGRKLSGGSASGSSGSQLDPTSPAGGHASQPSPAGKKSPGWNN